MQHFSISFELGGKAYVAKVQKINILPVQFIVYNIIPYIGVLPQRLVFLSNVADDQLVYQSFNVNQKDMIRAIGEELFKTCNLQKISIHA